MKEIDLSKISIEDLDVAPINIQILLELHSIYREKNDVVRRQDYQSASELRDRELLLLEKLQEQTGFRFSGYNDESILPKLRQLKIKLLLDEPER